MLKLEQVVSLIFEYIILQKNLRRSPKFQENFQYTANFKKK